MRKNTSRKDWLLLAALLLVNLVESLNAIYHYGYIGQDFAMHLKQALDYSQGFTYVNTNPPGLYLLAHAIRRWLSSGYFLELTALVLVLINLVSLAWVYLFAVRTIRSAWLVWSLMILVTFVPFRVIHSVVFATDALTMLPFIATAWFARRLLLPFRTSGQLFGAWLSSSVALTVGLYCKFTFIGMLPVLAAFLLYQLRFVELRIRKVRLAAIAITCLLIPSSFFVHAMVESYKVKSYTTTKHFRANPGPAAMSWRDVLFLRSRDVDLLAAPEYTFKDPYGQDSILVSHKYSYPGLLHLSMYSDTMNWFQRVPDGISLSPGRRIQSAFFRTRSQLTQRLSAVSVWLSIPVSLLAFIGTVLSFSRSLRLLISGRAATSPELVVLSTLAMGFYLVIVLSLPFVEGPYVWGYWLPRLVMPSLVTFIVLGFAELDRWVRRSERRHLPILAVAYATVLGGLYLWSLWPC